MKFIKYLFIASFCFVMFSCQNPASSDFIATESINLNTAYPSNFIEAYGTNFYKFVAVGAGPITITIRNLGSDLSVCLFTNPSYTTPNIIWELDDHWDSTDESGSTPDLISGNTYYLAIDEWDGVESIYDLQTFYP